MFKLPLSFFVIINIESMFINDIISLRFYGITASPLLKKIYIPEEIADQKIIVYKSRIDRKSVRSTAEKMKTQLFRKLFFIKATRRSAGYFYRQVF